MESAQDVKQVVQDTVSAFDGIDIIIANAGWTRFSDFMDLDALEDEEWDKVCLSGRPDQSRFPVPNPQSPIHNPVTPTIISTHADPVGMASQCQIAASTDESRTTTFHQEQRRRCLDIYE